MPVPLRGGAGMGDTRQVRDTDQEGPAMSYLTGQESNTVATVKALLKRSGIALDGLTVRSRDAHVTVPGWADPTMTTVSGVANSDRLALIELLGTLSGGTAYCGWGDNYVTVYWGGEE